VDHVGACEDAPGDGCAENADCPRGTFCEKEEGECDAVGECVNVPEACVALFDPVCGCDGRTYSNACMAATVGVSVDYVGECNDEPDDRCEDNSDCRRGTYCQKREGACDAVGECTVRPTRCPRIFDPVCGCDGVTYANACVAASGGATIDYVGECEDVVEDGCRTNRDCDAVSYCAKDDGDCDSVGECRVRPQICPFIFDPVCGCDGQTYSNACVAAAQGISVAAGGDCEQNAARPPRE